MADRISTGVKITASTDELEKKLELLTSKTARYITTAQKQAGVHEGLYGRLVNAQNKLVEGLTLSQIKLGQYVDEMGKVHAPNGEFVADLNRIEQALGFYADELGNVYNAQGKFIRITAETEKRRTGRKKRGEVATAVRLPRENRSQRRLGRPRRLLTLRRF